MTSLKRCIVTIGFAGALAIGTMSSSFAAPLMSSAGVIKAAPGQATEIAWRGGGGFRGGVARGGFRGGFARGGFRGGRGAGIVAGVAAGAIAGAAIANSGYYGPNYYADPYDAGPPVAYAPAYAPYGYAPSPYGDGPCVSDDGYGRTTPCQ